MRFAADIGKGRPSATAIFGGMLLIMFVGLMLQIVVAQSIENTSLKREIRILQKSNDIDHAQLSEVLYNLQRLQIEKEFAANRSYIEGVVATISSDERKEVYTQLWHNGYDRGTTNQQYLTQSEKDSSTDVIYTTQPE